MVNGKRDAYRLEKKVDKKWKVIILEKGDMP